MVFKSAFRFLAPFALVCAPAFAEDAAAPTVVCNVSGCSELLLPAPRFTDSSAFSTQQVWSVVNDILAVSGLLPNFQVLETTEVANAAAVILNEERYLAYNPDWIGKYRDDPDADWQLLGLIAHEVGHHLQGHTITSGGSRPPTELEADEYAGFILAALGANLVQAQSLWQTLSASGSATHPPRHQRLAAVERGWLKRQGTVAPAPAPVAAPAPTPSPRHAPVPARFNKNCVSAGTAQLCTSSVLSSQGSNSYHTRNMLDRDLSTAWVEGVNGHGISEGILFRFDSPTDIPSLALRNGYEKSNKTYTRNSRVKSLDLTNSLGQTLSLNISDQPGLQQADLSGLFDPSMWLLVEIAEVYPGTHYQDTAITEIGFE